MKLATLELDLLRVCAVEDWTSPDGLDAWAWFRWKHGAVNEAAFLGRLYLARLVDESNRPTFLGKVELWDAELRGGEQIARMAS